jgi:hypothetical protein
MSDRRLPLLAALLALMALIGLAGPATAQQRPGPGQFSTQELVDAGHGFFGGVSAAIASGIESAVARWGHPTAYILGEEGSGAFAVGLRYGEGQLRTRANRGNSLRIFWQGPSLGWDFGGDGSKVMILVYNVRQPQQLLRRFVGVSGSAYLVGGLAVTALASDDIVVVPIRSGVGLRLGANLGYLKFTDRPEWNPF